MHVIAVPPPRDQRVDQPAVLRLDIALEKGPDMIAAVMILCLDQRNVQIGSQFRQCQRDQSAGQTATSDSQIMLV